MKYNDLLLFVKHIAELLGLNPVQYGVHSLRRAGVQYLHSIGVSLFDMKSMGDWKSMAILQYLVAPLERRVKLERDICFKLGEH